MPRMPNAVDQVGFYVFVTWKETGLCVILGTAASAELLEEAQDQDQDQVAFP